MRVTTHIDAMSRAGLKTLAALPRVCEKSSASSTLGRDQQDLNAETRPSTAALRVEPFPCGFCGLLSQYSNLPLTLPRVNVPDFFGKLKTVT